MVPIVLKGAFIRQIPIRAYYATMVCTSPEKQVLGVLGAYRSDNKKLKKNAVFDV